MSRTKPSIMPWWLGTALIFLSVAFLGLGYLRSVSGLIHAFDSGLYLQLLSNLNSGYGWASSVTSETNFLGHHFQPMLVLLMPLHYLSTSTFSLLIVGWICSLVCIALLIKLLPQHSLSSIESASLAGLVLFLHPSLANRMYYSFVPEVMALPFLVYLAYLLARDQPLRGHDWAKVMIAALAAGLCKETLWMTSSWVCVLLALKHRKTTAFFYLSGLSLLFFLTFLYLFRIWMPEHSSMTQYFGLSFYRNEWVAGRWGFLGQILGAALNIFSEQSLETALMVLIFIPLGTTVLGNSWALAGALPALILVLAASHNQIHSLPNHYLLPALPFLAVSSAMGMDRIISRMPNAKLIFYFKLALVGVVLAVTFMRTNGYVFQTFFANERTSPKLLEEIAKLKKEIEPDDFVLIDGNLQPLFSEYRNTKVILGFQGNPTRLNSEDFQRAKHVITANDLADLEDCRSLKPAEGERMEFDYPAFYKFCEWLKAIKNEKKEYIARQLIDIKVLP